MAAPDLAHPLGTDHLGRDVLARLRAGGVNLLVAAVAAGVVSIGLGLCLGLASALSNGWLRSAARRLADLVQILPHLIVAALFVAVFGLSPIAVGLALGLAGAGAYALLVDGLVCSLVRAPHVAASRAMGAGRWYALRHHVLPAISPTVRAYAGSDLGAVATHYAALSFIGLGADSGAPDWGAMIYEYRLYVFDRPLLVLAPIAALAMAVGVLHLLLDPPQRPAPALPSAVLPTGSPS
jgi:ABC-type dipeptide/oligopeptide/nickel transport system permease subunit